jgi:hypothetical protein
MKLFFQKLMSVGGSLIVPDKTFVIIGDSIAKGTSNGVGNANDNVLYEFVSGELVNIPNDVQAAATGSWMPSFANKLNQELGRKINVSTHGSGGSEFSPYLDNNNWSTSGTLYSPMKSEVNALALLKNINAFIIILGINDARGTSNLGDIESNAFSLIDRLNSDFNTPKIYMVQIGRTESGVTTKVLNVRSIIEDLVSTYSNVKLAASLASFDNSFFYDNLHLIQSGNNTLGEELAEFLINDNI